MEVLPWPAIFDSTNMKRIPSIIAMAGASILCASAQTPAPTLDTRAAFMQIVTNYTVRTNAVVVTNYVVVTNAVIATNYYNAQGQLLTPVNPSVPAIPGLIPIPQAPQAMATPDPAAVKATQLQAIRELLAQALRDTSNKLAVAGSFTSNTTYQIQIPQGVTSFDRKKSQALLTAMNRTAERALPEAVAALAKTAAQVTTNEPASVIQGDKDAATRLLLAVSGENMVNALSPIVERAGQEHKLRETYSSVMLKGGGLLGSVLGTGPTVDIESHVTQGLLKAIINQLAVQESAIRTDPAARKTKVLQEVFKK